MAAKLNFLSMKIEEIEEKNDNLMNVKEICEAKYTEVRTLMEEMNSKYEYICARNDLMCLENEKLNDKNEVLKSRIAVLQGENSAMEVSSNGITNENKVMVVKNKNLSE